MDASFFIASKMKFKGRLATGSIALSFLIMIVAIAVASGFRSEIRASLSEMSGDISIGPLNVDYTGSGGSLNASASYLPYLKETEGVVAVAPVLYRGGIVKNGELVQGVIVKGVENFNADSLKLSVSVPSGFASRMKLDKGDQMLTYFVGEKVRVRKFHIADIHEDVFGSDDYAIVYADIEDLQRLDGPDGKEWVSAYEVTVSEAFHSRDRQEKLVLELSDLIARYSGDGDETALVKSSFDRYPQIMDWLNLIDFNVVFILLLMVIVACFNMVSGILIIIFENISTIGLLKALGMKDRSIAKVFLAASGAIVAKGMLTGNVLGVFLCLLQKWTGFLTLDPANYFLSAVPVNLDFLTLALCDALAFLVIMAVMALPSMFISRIDPARTVRVN